MATIAFRMRLFEGCEKEYERRHREIWPEIVELLKKQGVHNYRIFWDKETNYLFAVQDQCGEVSSQDMGTEPIIQKWWNYMADIMETNPDNSPVSVPRKEVFYME